MKFTEKDIRITALLELEEHIDNMEKIDDGHPSRRYVLDTKEKLIKGGFSNEEILDICLMMICEKYDMLIKSIKEKEIGEL